MVPRDEPLPASREHSAPPQYPIESVDPDLVQLTPKSIGTRDELFRALGTVRRRGYATSNGESEDGVSSVAIALDPPVNPPLAVNVSVPTNRMSAAVRRRIVECLLTAM